jgi:DNA adenine methylase
MNDMLSYFGGKNKIGKWILEYIPEDVVDFSEVFGGMFWTYFNMDLSKYPNLNRVIYNDFNPVNANLFRCVKDTDNFYEYIKDIPCQIKDKDKEGSPCDVKFKEMFKEYQKNAFRDEPFTDEADFERGMNYAYVLSQVFSGMQPETSSFIDLKHKYRSKFDTFRDKVGGIGRGKKFKSMFENITNIESLDFEKLINKYDSENFFVYLDPPYYDREKMYSNQDFGKEDHERLAKVIKNMKGRFILSYYDFPELEEWFPKDEYRWVSKKFAKASGAAKGKQQSMGEELLIMNY